MNRFMKNTAAAVLSLTMLASSAAALTQGSGKNGLTITASAADSLPPGVIRIGTYGYVNYWEHTDKIEIVGWKSGAASIYIPEKINNKPVKEIAAGAFSGCTTVKSVTINAKIENLYQETFADCTNLTSVELPKTLKTIGWNAFFRCSKLKKLHIPYETTSIEQGAFAGCTNLKQLIFHGNTTINTNVFKNIFNDTTTSFTGKFYCHSGTYPAAFAYFKHYTRVFYNLGDVDNNGIVNAVDASKILSFYASTSTGANITPAELEKMEVCADVNADGSVDAVDASAVLSYYAAISTNYTESLEYYMAHR